jgi:CheY-like chemotaxis protein
MNDTDRTEGGLRVLVVEDDSDAAQSYAALLELSGHRVRVAVDGLTALRLVAESVPDVALIDIGLPGIDGCEVARRIRGQSRGHRPLLVAITGYGMDDERHRAIAAGIDLHLLKPVDPALLLHLLRRFERVVNAVPPAAALAGASV